MAASWRAVNRADQMEPDHRDRRRGVLLGPVVVFTTLAILVFGTACGRLAEYASTTSARPVSSWSGEVQRLQQAGYAVRAVTNPLNGLDSAAASVGTDDKIITPTSQQAMARRAHARVAYVQGGSHLTLVSHPQAVTRQILAAVTSTCARR